MYSTLYSYKYHEYSKEKKTYKNEKLLKNEKVKKKKEKYTNIKKLKKCPNTNKKKT